MGVSYEAAAKYFREGEFLAVIRSAPQVQEERRRLEPRHRVLLAQSLALVGELDDAWRLAELDTHAPSEASLRSQAECTVALVRWRTGELDTARRHGQIAVQLARESNKPEQLAWAHLHGLRILIESGSTHIVLAALPEVRKAVAAAGLSQPTAYLHTCVAVLEGQMGRLAEARRHCDIAESLLKLSPNVWLTGTILVNRGCLACLNCEFANAIEHLLAAKDAARRSGHAHLKLAIDANIAQVQLLCGHFDRAKESIDAVLRDQRIAVAWRLAATETLARVHLALGQLDESERALQSIQEHITQHEQLVFTYHARWAAVTQARLSVQRGELDVALKSLEEAHARYAGFGDLRLDAIIQLVRAQTLARVGDFRRSAMCLVRAAELGVSGVRELQPQYHYASALIVRGLSTPLEQHLRERALRVWAEQGVVSVRSEMDGPTPDAPPNSVSFGDSSVECITNSLAAMADVAYKPRLLAAEMLSVFKMLSCTADARVVETRSSAAPPAASTTTAILPLGTDQRTTLTLVCEIPGDPVKAILLADVLRIGGGAAELERFRELDRNRAAVWPATPGEEQSGALFITDEMQSLLAVARRIASTTVPVLITGETGTGKEVLARVIHSHSNRAGATFLPFNCSGVPKEMLDSQLFGHRRGAFTGAIDSFPGVIRSAAGGTLFLDEIGETTLDVQPKLLRFLESNEVHPIGETQPVKVDVRVIAATNADLDTLVAQGRFREDLFYRLNIVRLHVPPLRERRVEIPPLANHYLQKHAQEYRKGDLRIAEETMEYLVLYRWPGNVRQLANEMRRMAALAETGAVLMPEHLSPEIAASRRTMPASERALDPTELVVRVDQPVAAAMQHIERAMIQYALKLCDGRMEETAAMLGLSRKGLYLKRLRYGLEPPGSPAAEVA